MTKKMTYQYDHATGIEEVREATEDELACIAGGAKYKAEREAVKAEQAVKKESAKSKLQDLGLDADEITALLGA